MFNQLSNQKFLSELYQSFSDTNKQLVSQHMRLIINSLNVPAKKLLENRRNHGLLIPVESSKPILTAEQTKAEYSDENAMCGTQKVLYNTSELYKFINKLCLTEAILIRDNFTNVLDEFDIIHNDEIIAESITTSNKQRKDSIEDSHVNLQRGEHPKSNVSPIRLTEIKNRLSHAITCPKNKEESVKSRLNALLTETENTVTSNLSKQA